MSSNTANKNYDHHNNNNINNSASANSNISTRGLNSNALENFQPTKQSRTTPTTSTTPSVSIYGRDHFKQYVSTPNTITSYFDHLKHRHSRPFLLSPVVTRRIMIIIITAVEQMRLWKNEMNHPPQPHFSLTLTQISST